MRCLSDAGARGWQRFLAEFSDTLRQEGVSEELSPHSPLALSTAMDLIRSSTLKFSTYRPLRKMRSWLGPTHVVYVGLILVP
jgi:hypothetical protein